MDYNTILTGLLKIIDDRDVLTAATSRVQREISLDPKKTVRGLYGEDVEEFLKDAGFTGIDAFDSWMAYKEKESEVGSKNLQGEIDKMAGPPEFQGHYIFARRNKQTVLISVPSGEPFYISGSFATGNEAIRDYEKLKVTKGLKEDYEKRRSMLMEEHKKGLQYSLKGILIEGGLPTSEAENVSKQIADVTFGKNLPISSAVNAAERIGDNHTGKKVSTRDVAEAHAIAVYADRRKHDEDDSTAKDVAEAVSEAYNVPEDKVEIAITIAQEVGTL